MIPNELIDGKPIFDIFKSAAAKHGTNWLLMVAQAWRECGGAIDGHWHADAMNPRTKAAGLAQFMPDTWKEMGYDADGDGQASPFDPVDAIFVQNKYMYWLFEYVQNRVQRADWRDAMLACYNWGAGHVFGNSTRKGIVRAGLLLREFLPAETSEYIKYVNRYYDELVADGLKR